MSQEKKVTEKEGAINCQMLISSIFQKKKQKTRKRSDQWIGNMEVSSDLERSSSTGMEG